MPSFNQESGRERRQTVYYRSRVYQEEPQRHLQHALNRLIDEGPINIRRMLDAGAGYELPIDIPADVHLVAIDTSRDALSKNENADETLVGDISTYAFKSSDFDAVLCWWVLEHLERPAVAITNLSHALRPGGFFIIGVPYLWSFKALVAKVTPHRFHIWYSKRIGGNADAGKAGFAPYKTYLKTDLSPKGIDRLAKANNLRVVYRNLATLNAEDALPRAFRLVYRAAGIF